MSQLPIEQLIKEIDEWLPQTQCTQCSYPRCHEYAKAIANKEVDINQCPPGGDATIRGLASLLNKIGKPLNTDYGEHKAKHIAVIDEDVCIGCVMCIKACPTDAIIGRAKRMHTVIPQDCTGCELCIEPCPVDCIEMIPSNDNTPLREKLSWRWDDYSPDDTRRARINCETKISRVEQRQSEKSSFKKLKQLRENKNSNDIKQDIAAAVKRMKEKQNR